MSKTKDQDVINMRSALYSRIAYLLTFSDVHQRTIFINTLNDLIYHSENQLFAGFNPTQLRFGKDPPT